MKLYLSSISIPNSREYTSLFGGLQTLSVAIIPNGWDVYPSDQRQSSINQTKDVFRRLGSTTTIVDLRTTTDNELKRILLNHVAIWVMGGNSFYLNALARSSGFAGCIREVLNTGVVYGGESAGAVLASKTLHGVELVDDPKKAAEVIWEGMGLVDFGIVPHWGMEKYTGLLTQCRDEMAKYCEVQTISNDQAIVWTDGAWRVVQGEA